MDETTALTDADIVTTMSDGPTEADEDKDVGGEGGKDTGDEPTERDADLDAGGEGDKDTGDEA